MELAKVLVLVNIICISRVVVGDEMCPRMVEPVVLVHGGAGDIPDSQDQPKLEGVRRAAKAGYAVLEQGGSLLDAVQAAVEVMEDDEAFNAGHGSVLNADGEVEMDAIVMEGTGLNAGAVGAIKNVSHPVYVARLVMENTSHVLLVGDGAKRFANDMGVPDVPMESLITQKAKDALEKFKKSKSNDPTRTELGGVGTVGAVAVDSEGHVVCATSTGGTSGKMVGRVGDTPIPGSGGYSDDQIGTVSTTGVGESIMKVNLAHLVLNIMKQGKTAQEATIEAVNEMTNRVGKTAGAITLSNAGDIGIGFNSKKMAWAYQKGNEVHYGIRDGDDFIEQIN
ncbi:isoaspartyl peptidase/L-asparaginase isoform X1 [Schistocerca americana]|uniref:isoaspartyl peptidase/L-asparaginase isoform X1 n=1 Tax=Schistocerca americana TaxID=7009 RepID=UPI001F4FEA97|nr:isoaspartyl peptidase/L-asparaginase isoform X1 [Schistocerca americana]XP_047112522.1 isoaspartyl peptidase/L-asparaginase isoform X1 [Schistocerca piceifrons]